MGARPGSHNPDDDGKMMCGLIMGSADDTWMSEDKDEALMPQACCPQWIYSHAHVSEYALSAGRRDWGWLRVCGVAVCPASPTSR